LRYPSLILMLLALAMRILAASNIPALTYDGVFYLRQAMRILQGSYLFESFPPGLPLAVALFGFAGADLEFVARCINIVAGVASVGLAYTLARRSLGSTASFVLALLLAIHPVFVRVQVEVWSEPLYLMVILGAFVLYERRRFTTSGLCLGYAFLLRPESLVLLAGLAIAHFMERRRLPWGMLLVGLTPVVLFAVLASQENGHFVITPKQGQWDLSANIWTRLITTFKTLHMVFPLVLLPVAFYEGIRRRSILLLPAVYLAGLPLYDIHIQQRIHLPAVVFLGILAMAWLARQSPTVRRSGAVASLAFLLWGTSEATMSFFKPGVMVQNSREVGQSFRPYVDWNDTIASRFPFIPWYAGAGFLRMELWPYDALVDSIRAQGATHLLVLENEAVNVRPQLRPLFEDPTFVKSESRLQLVHREERYPYTRALLYELREPPIPHSLPSQAEDIVSAAWLGSEWLAINSRGQLVAMEAGNQAKDLLATMHGPAQEVAVSPQAQKVALLRAEGRLDIFNPSNKKWQSFELGDTNPFQLTWIDERFALYLDNAGIRALDTQSGKTFGVELAGVAKSGATPRALAARPAADGGADLAITYQRNLPDEPLERALAITRWPASSPDPTQTLALQIRWGSFIKLHDDQLAWVPGQDQLLVSQAILLYENGETVGHSGHLSLIRQDGQTRRLSFHYPDATTPVFGGTTNIDSGTLSLLFIENNPHKQGVLHRVELQPQALRIPEVTLFKDPALRP
jgi:hypothetical protein